MHILGILLFYVLTFIGLFSTLFFSSAANPYLEKSLLN